MQRSLQACSPFPVLPPVQARAAWAAPSAPGRRGGCSRPLLPHCRSGALTVQSATSSSAAARVRCLQRAQVQAWCHAPPSSVWGAVCGAARAPALALKPCFIAGDLEVKPKQQIPPDSRTPSEAFLPSLGAVCSAGVERALLQPRPTAACGPAGSPLAACGHGGAAAVAGGCAARLCSAEPRPAAGALMCKQGHANHAQRGGGHCPLAPRAGYKCLPANAEIPWPFLWQPGQASGLDAACHTQSSSAFLR